jgi:hypothetical protein
MPDVLKTVSFIAAASFLAGVTLGLLVLTPR